MDHPPAPDCATATGVVVLNARTEPLGPRYVELLFQFAERLDVTHQQAHLITHLLSRLSDLLAHERLPAVFTNGPVAQPTAKSPQPEGFRLSVGPCLRMGVSAANTHTRARLRFQERAVQLAAEFGLGLWINEGRAGFSLWYWRPIRTFVPDAARRVPDAERKDGIRGRRPDRTKPTRLVALTLVGPSRPSTPRDLRKLATYFQQTGVGTLAVSAASMQQAVFIHLLLPLPPPRRWRRGRIQLPSAGPMDMNVATRLSQLCGTNSPGEREYELPDDYFVALSSVVPLPRRSPEKSTSVVPYWIRWGVPQVGIDSRTVIGLVHEAFEEHGRQSWTTYLRARRTGRDRLRGRAKLSVRVPAEWTFQGHGELSVLAKRVEEHVRFHLLRVSQGEHSLVRVNVAWGERWLDGMP